MDCRECQESILASFDEPLVAGRAIEHHLATCENCCAFAATHRLLDARLQAAVPAAQLSAGFRTSIRKRMRRDTVSAWPDFLPDLAHLAGCSIATIVLVVELPLPAHSVLLAGAAFTGVTFFLQAVLRASLDGLEGEA